MKSLPTLTIREELSPPHTLPEIPTLTPAELTIPLDPESVSVPNTDAKTQLVEKSLPPVPRNQPLHLADPAGPPNDLIV